MTQREIIKLEAEIDLTIEPNQVRIKPVDDIWMDFGYWLEATAFMLRQAAGYKEKSIDEMVNYAANYLKRAAEDYRKIQ